MQVPRECPGVPTKMLLPETQWDDENAFVDNICKLGDMFNTNFQQFKEGGPGMLPQVRANSEASVHTLVPPGA
jgi:phosphoenolpyruvate carboxykinase (ATP)